MSATVAPRVVAQAAAVRLIRHLSHLDGVGRPEDQAARRQVLADAYDAALEAFAAVEALREAEDPDEDDEDADDVEVGAFPWRGATWATVPDDWSESELRLADGNR